MIQALASDAQSSKAMRRPSDRDTPSGNWLAGATMASLAAGAVAYLRWARYHRSWPFGTREIHEEFRYDQPVDAVFAEGPFGGTFLHQYSISASRPVGTRLSIAGQYAGTFGRTISDGTLNSQWLRLISLGYNLGPDSNVALELQGINGLVNGLTTVPGVNLADRDALYERMEGRG